MSKTLPPHTETVEPAVVVPGAACVFSASGDVAEDGEVVTVDGTPCTVVTAMRAVFVPLGEQLHPNAIALSNGDVLLTEIFDETGEGLLGHVEQVVHGVMAPKVNVSSLEADPRRPAGDDDDLTYAVHVHRLTKAPSRNPASGDPKR